MEQSRAAPRKEFKYKVAAAISDYAGAFLEPGMVISDYRGWDSVRIVPEICTAQLRPVTSSAAYRAYTLSFTGGPADWGRFFGHRDDDLPSPLRAGQQLALWFRQGEQETLVVAYVASITADGKKPARISSCDVLTAGVLPEVVDLTYVAKLDCRIQHTHLQAVMELPLADILVVSGRQVTPTTMKELTSAQLRTFQAGQN